MDTLYLCAVLRDKMQIFYEKKILKQRGTCGNPVDGDNRLIEITKSASGPHKIRPPKLLLSKINP